MNLEQKKQRLAELRRLSFPSDQDIEEIDQLLEQIQLERDGDVEEPKQVNQKPVNNKQMREPKKPKRTILGWIKDTLKEKPVTQAEIDQLKMKAIKERYKADIRISKSKGRANSKSSTVLKDLFGPEPTSSGRGRSSKSYDYPYKESKEKQALRRKTLGY